MAQKTHNDWSRRLAEINEAIFDGKNELVMVKTERAYFEARLKKAQKRGETDPSILSSLKEKYEFYDKAFSKLYDNLASYNEHLRDHYSKKPSSE